MKRLINRCWKPIKENWADPVWSKVFSAVILAIASFILGLLWFGIRSLISNDTLIQGWGSFINFLGEEVTFSGKRVLFLLIVLLWLVISLPLINSIYEALWKKPAEVEPVVEEELPVMHDRSTVFLDNRMADAFPGLRGLKWYRGSDAVARLAILLKTPLRFAEGSPQINDPLWWFRGGRNASIRKSRVLGAKKILIDHHEYIIDEIAVYRDDDAEKSFIYLKTKADRQAGVYNYSKSQINSQIENHGFHREEYAIFNGKYPVTREEYDDGAAEINGKVIERTSAELRTRYLSNYNFVIAAKQSPVNSKRFDRESPELFKGLLDGTHNFQDLLNFLQELDDPICQ